MEIEDYVNEYKQMRTALGRKNSFTGDECACLYAIYRKDIREGPRNNGKRSFTGEGRTDGPLASSKTKVWLKDLRDAGKISISNEKLEMITQKEASEILKGFERK